MTASERLLRDYLNNGSETAFRELVARYIDFVYSAAVRLVNGDSHLAEDITQIVFLDLARLGRTFPPEVALGGWLHRHTCFVSSKTLRGERRRQNREKVAMEINAVEDHSAGNLAIIAPAIDEAVDQLGPEDRQAVLLRFFEQQNFRDLAAALGTSEDAARKRVDRAVEKLQVLLKRRGVSLPVASLAAALGVGVVTAAPVGLGVTIAGSALVTAAGTTGALTLFNFITMTKLQTVITCALVMALAIPLIIQNRSKEKLRAENELLRTQVAEVTALRAENQRLARSTAQVTNAPRQSNEQVKELMKLRGEVGRLRQESATEAANKTNGPSPLSALTSTPEMQKLIHDQQKMGMSVVYGGFIKNAKLSDEQKEKFNDILADHVMTNINNVTSILHDHKAPAEMNEIFANQEAVLLQNVQSLLGPDGQAQYQDYTRNLISHLTADQFKGMMSGDEATKTSQSAQLYRMMQEETQQALARAGLDADYQLVPTLNFRNFASSEETERNLNLLDSIYGNVAEKAKAFLAPQDAEKFATFRTKALSNNRVALDMNRKMMAPTSK